MDPTLSPEANRLLQQELRIATGRSDVDVPAGRRGRGHAGTSGVLAGNRPLLLVTLLTAIVVGAIVALATHSWIALVIAVGVHALCTLLAATGVIQLSTETEHMDPDVAAALEAQGVADPDRVLTEMVQEVAGDGEQTVGHEADPARAAVEQRTAGTPTSRPTAPAGGGAVSALPWWIVLALMVLSVAFAIAEGGRMWLLPVLILPIGVGWIVLTRAVDSPGEERAAQRGETYTPSTPRRRVTTVASAVVAGVVIYMIIVAAILGVL